MKKFVIGLAALPFMAGIALAGDLLSNQQMDQVTAGFSSLSFADAQALGRACRRTTCPLVSPATTRAGRENARSRISKFRRSQHSQVDHPSFQDC